MSRVLSAALAGVDGAPVEVEVRISSQLPRIDVVGLPAAAVRESAARVRSAIQAVGQRFPDRRVTVSLAPAELRKTGAALDLPIAIAILAEAGAIEPDALTECAFVGELALDGRLRPVRGALALALAVRDTGCKRLVAPAANASEIALAPNLASFAATDLAAVIAHLLGAETLPHAEVRAADDARERGDAPDLRDVRGQESAKRALEVAAAGGHALLLRGAPGAGKSMLARRLPGLLDPLDTDAWIEVVKIHGAAGRHWPLDVRERPFRAPHHSATTAGLLGGGSPPRPGEVSLAHRGVLFLDELAEFERRSLEALRQILEEGHVAIARARFQGRFPARFQLVAASNPCPCGWYGSPLRDCRCDDATVARYTARISGPLLDRIDLCCRVQPVAWRDLADPGEPESSAAVRKRCDAARAIQRARGRANAALRDAELEAVVDATAEARNLLGQAVDRFGLSVRSARKTLKLARTIADLAGAPRVEAPALAEALGYRPELGDPV